MTFCERGNFKLQFEVSASKVDDKDDREGCDLLHDQLSPIWQEKIIKVEKTRTEGQNCVLFSSVVLSITNLMRILEAENIRYNTTSEKGKNFLVQCIDPTNTLKALQLSGKVFGRDVLRVSRSDIPMTTRDFLKLVIEKLRFKEEAQSRWKNVPFS